MPEIEKKIEVAETAEYPEIKPGETAESPEIKPGGVKFQVEMDKDK